MNIEQRRIEGSLSGRITLSPIKLTMASFDSNSKMKRRFTNNRSAFRNTCRDRIHKMSNYIAENMATFIDTIFRKETCPLVFESSKLAEMELNNVRMGYLCDFRLNLRPFEFKPTFEQIERDLKKSLLKSISRLGSIPAILTEDAYIKEHYNFCFEAAQDHLADSLRFLDEFLAEAAMPLIALLYCLQSFAHLMFDRDELLCEELQLLLTEVPRFYIELARFSRDRSCEDGRRQQDPSEHAEPGARGGLRC